ncbi:MAG: hypothetical protein E6J90_30190 [Deltaproteobacteria bacterium]|nr:MAG: hypothetical protein E6J90_30190 [Deltaproteobacteria bacterium]
MSRVRLSLLSIALIAGCGPLATGASSSSGSYGSATVHTTAGVEVGGDDNFAAMEEVPVAGGELRARRR